MSLETIFKGRVSRALPQPDIDGGREGEPARIGRYDEVYVQTPGKRQHVLADEGSYFVANNNSQTGILATPAVGWVATTPLCIITNTDSPSNTWAKRIYLDFAKFATTVVGSAASGLVRVEGAVYTDNTDRYTSGGSDISANIVSTNQDGSARSSVAKVRFGALTAAAATGAVRAIDPYFVFRASVSGTVADVVGEQKLLNFGSVETMLNGGIVIANANNITVPLPPVIIGPNQCCLIYYWQAVGATPVAATFAPQLAWWER